VDPARLRAILAVLSDAGVKSAKVPVLDAEEFSADRSLGLLEVEFAEPPEPVTPFVARDGKPVDLDEGAGPLARDPDAELEGANFPKPKPNG
jgi:hypothetical protein